VRPIGSQFKTASKTLRRKTGVVVFDKGRDRFDANVIHSLICLAVPAESGIYLGTTPKQETIYSNLMRIAPFPAVADDPDINPVFHIPPQRPILGGDQIYGLIVIGNGP
jgi:hypothetical protein